MIPLLKRRVGGVSVSGEGVGGLEPGLLDLCLGLSPSQGTLGNLFKSSLSLPRRQIMSLLRSMDRGGDEDGNSVLGVDEALCSVGRAGVSRSGARGASNAPY